MKNFLSVAFIRSSGLSDKTVGETLVELTKDSSCPIRVSFIDAYDGVTVDQVTDSVLGGDFDAVVVEHAYGFDDPQSSNSDARDEAYEQLGLMEKKKPWQDSDPNYYRSGIALVSYLRRSFQENGKAEPQFGYVHISGANLIRDWYKEMGVEENADFYLATGYESPSVHEETIRLVVALG